MVRVEQLLLPGQTPWRPVSGRVLLLLPHGSSLAYGDRLQATGVFLPSAPPAFPRAFDYHRYLRSNGIRQVFQAQAVACTGSADGLVAAVRGLLAFRDALAARLVTGVASEENAGILLAMTFGFRQTMPAETRDAFLRSGTIHVFSVSGLHVGIVAVVLGYALYLAAVPYRWRYGLLPLLLGVYVVMTGSAPPALRAWLMVCAVSWARALFLSVSALNGVAFAALLIMAANPLVLFQAGFLYSFTTVAVLVLGWPLLSALVADLCERHLWLPRSHRPRWQAGAVRRLIQALGASVLAWFGGSGLMLYLSGMLVPAALPVNVVLVVLAHVLLVMALPKVALACLPWALPNQLAGGLMNVLVEVIRVLVTCGSAPAGSWAVPSPPVALIAVYYVALLVALMSRWPWRWRGAALATTVTVLVAGAWAPWHRPAMALVWGADCDVPVVAIERPGGLPPIVVHCGTTETFRPLLSWLQLRGHRRTDALVFGWDSRRAVEAAPDAVRLLHADTLIVPGAPRPGSFLAQACLAQRERGARARTLASPPDATGSFEGGWPGGHVGVDLSPERRRLQVDSISPEGPLHIELEWDVTGRYRVTVPGPDGSPSTHTGTANRQRRLTEAAVGPCLPSQSDTLSPRPETVWRR